VSDEPASSSRIALKWLRLLEQPRTIQSLILEVYGEAALYGAQFELQLADILNFFEMRKGPETAVFNTRKSRTSDLIKQIEDRKFVPEDVINAFKDGNDARNELIHRLLTKRLPGFSKSELEIFLSDVAHLHFRIWDANRYATSMKKQVAAQVGVTEERVENIMSKMKEEARLEDENLRRLLGGDFANE
jgi:hypothetical protein